MPKKQFSLATLKNSVAPKNFLKGLQSEIVQEEQDALKDFIKGAYRLSLEKEKEMEKLQKEVDELKVAIELASKGNWDKLAGIKIPSRFFNESTLRRHGKTLISGSEELRFLDLYVNEEE